MRPKVCLLLAGFVCVVCMAFSQIKVLKAEKFIDTNAIFYKTYKAQCASWMLTNAQIEYVLKNSESVKSRSLHHYVTLLPASYSGDVLFRGKPARFEINAGAFSKIFFKDSSFFFEYKRADHKKFFIERTDQYSKSDFKLFFQYSADKKGIEVPMMWSNRIIQTSIDNHSPSWLNKKALQQTKHIKSDATYNTTTVDGANIKGDVYLIDTVGFGPFYATSVPVYLIDNGSNEAEGVIGDDVLSNTVVGIFFNRRTLTLSSDLFDFGETTELNSDFTSKGIAIEVKFRNGMSRTLYLDLGFNGMILLPEKEFDMVTKDNPHVITRKSRLTTATDKHTVDVKQADDRLSINGISYPAALYTNSSVQERLIGLAFFSSYKFLIIDYKHKRVLISKN